LQRVWDAETASQEKPNFARIAKGQSEQRQKCFDDS